MNPCKSAKKPIVGIFKSFDRIGAEKALIVTSNELLPGHESKMIDLVPSSGKESFDEVERRGVFSFVVCTSAFVLVGVGPPDGVDVPLVRRSASS